MTQEHSSAVTARRHSFRWSDMNGLTLAVAALVATIATAGLSEARFQAQKQIVAKDGTTATIELANCPKLGHLLNIPAVR